MSSCSTTHFYIVRHAEKETVQGNSDSPLSAKGTKRAEDLRDLLSISHIRDIYSTDYIRTRSTVAPLATLKHKKINIYNKIDFDFLTMIRESRHNVLIAGHSNTVDDLVNGIAGQKFLDGNLEETEYGDLFILTRKGKHFSFERKRFGDR